MNAYRVQTRLTQDKALQLSDLPFQAGTEVEVIILEAADREEDQTLLTDWQRASSSTLQEVWDNDEDAIYDTL